MSGAWASRALRSPQPDYYLVDDKYIGGHHERLYVTKTTALATESIRTINASLIDLGDRFRLLVNCVDAVETPHSLPKLPVANALWKAQPDLPTASEAWILAGGAHHTVFSHALDLNDMRQFAELHDIELTVIDNDTRLPAFKDALRWNEVYYMLANGLKS